MGHQPTVSGTRKQVEEKMKGLFLGRPGGGGERPSMQISWSHYALCTIFGTNVPQTHGHMRQFLRKGSPWLKLEAGLRLGAQWRL